MNRHRRLAAVAVAGLLAGSFVLCACNWYTGGWGRRKKPKQGIVIRCNQPRAMIFVDEEPMGQVMRYRAWPLALRPGAHRVEIRHPGFYSRYLDVTVGKDEVAKVDVTLRRRLH